MKKLITLLTIVLFSLHTAHAQESEDLKKGSMRATALIIGAIKHANDLEGSFRQIKGTPIKGKNSFEVVNFKNPFNDSQEIAQRPDRMLQYSANVTKEHIPYYVNALNSYLPRTIQLGKFTVDMDNTQKDKCYRIFLNNAPVGTLELNSTGDKGLLNLYRPI